SNKPGVAAAAARALGRMQANPEMAAPALGKALAKSPSAPVRRAAAEALGQMVQAESQRVKSLQGTPLGTTHTELQKTALLAAGELGPGLADADKEVRGTALTSLRQVATALGETVMEGLPLEE